MPKSASKLASLCSKVPIFNESIERKWCQEWKPRKNFGYVFTKNESVGIMDVISIKEDVQPNILETFCCLTNFDLSKKRIELSEIAFQHCKHAATNKKQ